MLEIARGNRPDPFDLHYRRDEPLIPRELRFEVAERMDSKGEVVTPLDTAALKKLADEIKTLGVESVAIFFMNSYIKPGSRRRRRGEAQRISAGYLRHLQHGFDARVVRVRAQLDGRRQRLRRAAGEHLHSAAR